MAKLPSNIISNDAAMRPNTIPSSPIVSDDDSTSAGTVLIKDEVAMRKTQKGTLTPITKKLQPQAKALLKIKSLVRDVISQQTDTSVNETELEANRKKLNSAYKAYVKKFGRIFDHKLTSRIKPTSFAEQIFSSDPEMYLLRSLELVTYPKDGAPIITPSQILDKRTYTPYTPTTKVDTAQDGLIASLHDIGHVDLDHISKLYGKPTEEIIKELGDEIYKNPAGGYETADEYLSGNVRKKLKIAQQAAQLDSSFNKHVEMLKKVVPGGSPNNRYNH